MSVYKNLLVYITLALFLSACSILQPRKQTVYDISDKAEAVEVDTDDNGAIDISYGGTNASNAATALTNIGAGDITEVGSVTAGAVTAAELHTDILAYWVVNGLNLSSVTVTFPSGGWYFTDENSAPSVVGQFKYDNTITGLDDGGMSYYDDDEVKYIADYATLPTTNGQDLTYNSSTQKWVPTKKSYQKCTTALAVTASSDWAVERFPFAITITDIYVYQNGATNVIGGLDECTGANGTCGSVTAVDSDITGTDGAEVQDDGSLTNGGITAGNRVKWHTTSVSGTNTDIQICFDYTRD